jgi:hypothetical protein
VKFKLGHYSRNSTTNIIETERAVRVTKRMRLMPSLMPRSLANWAGAQLAFSVTDRSHGPNGDGCSVYLQIRKRESFVCSTE